MDIQRNMAQKKCECLLLSVIGGKEGLFVWFVCEFFSFFPINVYCSLIKGMQSARGALLLFADADGATKFSDLTKLEESITNLIKGSNEALQKKNYLTNAQFVVDYWKDQGGAANALGICVGSRAHLEEVAIASRSLFRTILMYGFHFLVWLFAVRGIRDTQCGFKLLTRRAAAICFASLHVERW